MRYSKSVYNSVHNEKSAPTNPMLIHGAGIATVAAACSSAINAVALTLIMLVLCAAMSVVYMFEREEYIQPMRTLIYFVPAVMLTFVSGIVLNAVSPRTAESLGIYLPILAADAIVLARLEEDAPFVPSSQALPEALKLWWMYAVLALPIGALREILGKGEIFGCSISFLDGSEALTYPFAGFIMLGFGMAIVQKLNKNQE